MFARLLIMPLAVLATTSAYAQSYPDKAMRMIVPFSAGAGTDLLSRVIARKLQEAWGQNMIVENRPGGGTIIGVEVAAKAPPDGYTLVMVTPSFIINATGIKKLPYDSIRDFAPVTLFATSPLLLVAHPSLPVKSVKELITLAKARPAQITYASAGNGSPTHLGMEVFKSLGAVMIHVPYKGAAPGVIDLLGGHVQVMMTTLAFVKPHVETGKLTALGVSTAKRLASLPRVPAIAETLPGYEVINWWGILAPAGTPGAIVTKLNGAMVNMLRDADVQETLAREGIDRAGSTAAEFSAYIRSEIAKWTKVAKETGVQLD
ncbi:MAG: tripartite tricarboxylate transporter substrate binding protein [Betaproteobacteria bacterium]|nr:tripartite tricarboxylate transporter substrate binding protein [Betaproteobacteria bacterium]